MMSPAMKNKIKWDDELLVEMSNNGYADLNILLCEGAMSDYKAFSFNINKKYFDRNINKYNDKYKELVEQVRHFISQYKLDGRRTIMRYLWSFFTFQYENNYEIGKDIGVVEYRISLINNVRIKKFNIQTMSSYFSVMNRFLKFSGQIKKKYPIYIEKIQRSENKKAYSKQDFIEIINILFFINEKTKEVIDEHIDAVESGIRDLSVFRLPRRLMRYKASEYDIEIDMEMPSCYINDYIQSSFLLFALFTWGNKKQLLELDVDNLHLTDSGVESDFIFKARAQKFVRYNIGKSSIDGHRSGLTWCKGFLETREKILKFLQDYEHVNCTKALFFKTGNDAGVISVIAARDSRITDFFAIYKVRTALKSRGVNIPTISLPAIRNTSEQLADQNLNNPLVIAQKAQHEWGTYQNNYAKGNPIESKELMGEALETLLVQGIGSLNIDERKERAKEIGIILDEKKSDDIDLLINGLGCMTSLPESKFEKKFKQKHGINDDSSTKCADFANCLNCEKSCLIEDENAIYNLLSFRNTIEYGRPQYDSSKEAIRRYEGLVTKINIRLSLIDKNLLSKSEKKLRVEGEAPAWRL
jgi:hypothetical protein